MAGTRTQLIEAMFKPAEGGYLFRAPPPFFVWPARFYVVTEAQKDQLAPVAVPRYVAIQQIATMLIALCGGPVLASLAVWRYTGHDSPNPTDIAAVAVLTLLLMLVVFLARRWWLVWKLAPMLNVLPRSETGFSLKEMRERAYQQMSVRQLVVVGAISTAAAAVMAMTAFEGFLRSRPDAFVYAGCAVVFAFTAAIYFKRLILRAEAAKD
jgi:hypothetical protein